MKKILLMMSLFLSALLMVNCGDKKSSGSGDDEDLSPKEVVEKFLNGMIDRDIDAVLSCVDQEKLERRGHDAEEEAEKEFDRHDGVESFKIKTVTEDGSGKKASVDAFVEFGDGYSTTMGYNLKKIDGRWLIVN